MESDIVELYRILRWVGGLSFTGFLSLVGWMLFLSGQVKGVKHFTKQFDMLIQDVHEIKNALLGTYEKKGLITKVSELEKKLDDA